MGLLDIYNSMVASQTETEKVAEEQTNIPEQEQQVDERMLVLEKYAALADDLLAEEYGEDYKEEDVVKLAELMINHDIEVQQQMEKVAELHEAGIIIARAHYTELDRLFKENNK